MPGSLFGIIMVQGTRNCSLQIEICRIGGKIQLLIIGLHLYEKKVDFIFDFSSSWFFCVL